MYIKRWEIAIYPLASYWNLKICLKSVRWRISFLWFKHCNLYFFLMCSSTGKSLFLCSNVQVVFPETVTQSASYLPNEDCPRTFTARNTIDEVIWSALEMPCVLNLSSCWWNWGWLVNVRRGQAWKMVCFAGEGARLLRWLIWRKVAMDEQIVNFKVC